MESRAPSGFFMPAEIFQIHRYSMVRYLTSGIGPKKTAGLVLKCYGLRFTNALRFFIWRFCTREKGFRDLPDMAIQ